MTAGFWFGFLVGVVSVTLILAAAAASEQLWRDAGLEADLEEVMQQARPGEENLHWKGPRRHVHVVCTADIEHGTRIAVATGRVVVRSPQGHTMQFERSFPQSYWAGQR